MTTINKPAWTCRQIQRREHNCELDWIHPASAVAVERYGPEPTTEDRIQAAVWERHLLDNAPRGYTICGCGYERPVGTACGEPCA